MNICLILIGYRDRGGGRAQSVKRLDTGWTVRGSNPGGGEIFRTRRDRPLGPTQPPVQWVPGLSMGVKWPGREVDHPPPYSAEVEGRVELYICSPSGPSWPVLGRTLPLTLPITAY
jgi:hypothetical protein